MDRARELEAKQKQLDQIMATSAPMRAELAHLDHRINLMLAQRLGLIGRIRAVENPADQLREEIANLHIVRGAKIEA